MVPSPSGALCGKQMPVCEQCNRLEKLSRMHPQWSESMSTETMQRILLLGMAAGLPPVALSYGIAPETTLPFLYGIEAGDVNVRHIFRAMMGLYLAMVSLWVAGALRPNLRLPALWSLATFTGGIGLGRALSLIIDGPPHPLLLAYMVIEFFIAGSALLLIRRSAVSESKT